MQELKPGFTWHVEYRLGAFWADVVGIGDAFAIIVEVKTKREDWCAGSVIRQLRTYSTELLAQQNEIREVQLLLFSEEVSSPRESY